jgi:diaminopropionate ammonia-lyase family
MIHRNSAAARSPYPAALHNLLDIRRAQECRRWLSAWSMLNPGPTPVWDLPAVARRLDLGAISVKDESARSSLGSFKALGAPAALLRLVLGRIPGAVPEEVLRGTYAATLKDYVVISATDGNHGRALAAAARSAGIGCVIVLHGQVSEEREAAIAALGAEIVRIAGNYDESVREAARLAAEHGWQVVSDTSYEGYEGIPRDVMQGYGVMVDELLDGTGDAPCPYTHLIVQGGVGGLAAGVFSYFWERYGEQRPVFVVVEPEQADCLLQSAIAGVPRAASGTVDSVMAGLACGEVSPLAWRFLESSVDIFMTVTDAEAVAAMRALAQPSGGDIPILSGESGAAGFAALPALGLAPTARVLLLNTEGATAPALYESLAGLAPADVLSAQAGWLAARKQYPATERGTA